MIEPGRREALRRATASVSARVHRMETTLETRRDRPAEPGDLWVLPQTAELPLEWLVVERDAADPARVFVVPADTSPASGPADVVVPKDAACGPLRLRCGNGTWIASPEGAGARRTGIVEPAFVERARERCAALRAEPGAADVEYEDWMDGVVRPGARALTALASRPARSKAAWAQPWAIAASALLALGLGFAAGHLPISNDRVAGLEAELQRLRARPPVPIPSPAVPKETAAPPVETNVPFIWLAPSEPRRGSAAVLNAPAGAARVVIVLQVDDPEPGRRYRLDVVGERPRRTLWSGRGLAKTGVSEVVLALPRGLLPAGTVTLRLYDEPAATTPRAEYAFRIEDRS